MKVLAFGDVYGRIGRKSLEKELPKLKKMHNPDLIIVNVDNLSSGRGAIEKHLYEMEKLGIDIMTGGDHVLDNITKITDYLENDNSLLIRPANFQSTHDFALPGRGYKIIEKNNKKIAVIHLLGAVFMGMQLQNPFSVLETILSEIKPYNCDAIIVDFHKETTAEGYGLAHFFDGQISAVFGTHTHVQTNDEIILDSGTGLLSDLGMCGPQYSVIGADFGSVKKRFLTGINKGKIEQSLDSRYVVSGAVFDIDENGKTKNIEKIKLTGKL